MYAVCHECHSVLAHGAGHDDGHQWTFSVLAVSPCVAACGGVGMLSLA